MSTIQPGGNFPPIGTTPPSAAKLARGTHAGNLDAAASNLAQDSAAITSSMSGSTRASMVKDVQTLKVQLWSRLGDHLATSSLMAAGALMGGPQGFTLNDLAAKLHATVGSKEKMSAFADQVKKFTDHQPGEAPGLADRFQSLNNRVSNKVGPELSNVGEKVVNAPVALFISGALANAYQDQGNILP